MIVRRAGEAGIPRRHDRNAGERCEHMAQMRRAELCQLRQPYAGYDCCQRRLVRVAHGQPKRDELHDSLHGYPSGGVGERYGGCGAGFHRSVYYPGHDREYPLRLGILSPFPQVPGRMKAMPMLRRSPAPVGSGTRPVPARCFLRFPSKSGLTELLAVETFATRAGTRYREPASPSTAPATETIGSHASGGGGAIILGARNTLYPQYKVVFTKMTSTSPGVGSLSQFKIHGRIKEAAA